MITAIITDFDGTLVDTFEANLLAYREAFARVGRSLGEEQYRACFGLRFDSFMEAMGIDDPVTIAQIRQLKKDCYPRFFAHLRPNTSLIEFIRAFHRAGGKTAIASTARRENLLNALDYLHITPLFDLIFAGRDVAQGKPSPEIYIKTMAELGVAPANTLIFEDSQVGLQAAEAGGASCIKIKL